MSIPLLSNFDFLDLAKIYNLDIIDCLSQERFVTIKPKKGAYIVNINDGGSMGHWTCFIIKNNTAIYFDSFGCVPPIPIIKFLKRGHYKLIINRNDIQLLEGVECGFYCLAFLDYMKKHQRIPCELALRNFTALFKDNTNKNANILQNYIKDNFPI